MMIEIVHRITNDPTNPMFIFAMVMSGLGLVFIGGVVLWILIGK